MPNGTFKRVRGPWPGVSAERRKVMQANKPRDTAPEMQVRRMLHAMGYRFRLHCKDLPGRPDIVFPSRRAVIQVHGCFWHQHPGCAHAHVPNSRLDYWGPKFARNIERDRDNRQRLTDMGWRCLVLWECDLSNAAELAQRTAGFLGPPGNKTRLDFLPSASPSE
jgi:DNA mismatch endonuclease (patch repair protein)